MKKRGSGRFDTFAPMGIIRLTNVRTFSFHGCLEEESRIGSDYRVDLEVKADLRKAKVTDELADTVDYVYLNRVIIEEMAIRAKLLEHVAHRIVSRIFADKPEISTIRLSVAKLNPPIGGDVASVAVELEEFRS
ncbi:MAG TPA: dihydroneopterin aldolase [Flavobacterium sp.]|nr:dihydroneopterin aldolase [Flavobacterium sp.]